MEKKKKIIIASVAILLFSAASITCLSFSNLKQVHNFWLKLGRYDAYVDGKNTADGNGTRKNPFRTISEAIASVKNNGDSHRIIFVHSGEYKEKIIMEDGIFLYGENMEDTTIKGEKPYADGVPIPVDVDLAVSSPAVYMKNNTALDNFTITRGAPGIIVESNATIKNCLIKNAQIQGIDVLSGKYSFQLTNSEITGTIGKALYIQKGRQFLIDKVISHHNDGEGIDLREELTGKITNSKIFANGEAGIEFIIGNSTLDIKNNILVGNNQDGIQAQFCSGESCDNYESMQVGRIIIKSNTISYNSEWGIRCNIPSGIPENSPYTSDFWKKSIHLASNQLEGNRKDYDSRCKFEN